VTIVWRMAVSFICGSAGLHGHPTLCFCEIVCAPHHEVVQMRRPQGVLQ
jgi:hypothetical protein